MPAPRCSPSGPPSPASSTSLGRCGRARDGHSTSWRGSSRVGRDGPNRCERDRISDLSAPASEGAETGTDLGGGGSPPPGPAPTTSASTAIGSAQNRARPRIGPMNLKVAVCSETLGEESVVGGTGDPAVRFARALVRTGLNRCRCPRYPPTWGTATAPVPHHMSAQTRNGPRLCRRGRHLSPDQHCLVVDSDRWRRA